MIVNDDGRYTAYDGSNGAVRGELAAGGHIDAASVSPDGDVFATSSGTRVELRDAHSGVVVSSFDTGRRAAEAEQLMVTALMLDDTRHVAVGHRDGSLQIWDAAAASGRLSATLGGHQGSVDELVLRGDRLLSGSWDGALRAWRWPEGESLGVVITGASAEVAVSPSGRRLVTPERDAVVDVLDGETGQLLQRIPTMELIKAVAFIGEDVVLAAGAKGTIERIEPRGASAG